MHDGVLKVGLLALGFACAPPVGAQGGTVGRPAIAAMTRVAPRLPNVVGLKVDSATMLLALTHLPIVRRESATNAVARDLVIDQQPVAGTPLSSVREIIITVAIPARTPQPRDSLLVRIVRGVIITPRPDTNTLTRPPSTTVVPMLVGRNWSSAVTAITGARLRLDRQVVTALSDLADSGFVFQQQPLPYATVSAGSAVKLWISMGRHPTPPTVTTPNVLGKTLDSAERMLRRAQLVARPVDTMFESGGRGLVGHQLPEPGDQAHPGDAVALRVVMDPPLIPVPPLIGLRSAAARNLLRHAGLELGQVTPVTGRAKDTVIVAQNPRARAGVIRGTFVDVEENQPRMKRIPVPPLTGLTQAAAEQRLTADSLIRGDVIVPDTGSAPVVVAQEPPAGDSVFLHSAVSITLRTPVQQGSSPTTKTETTLTLIAVPSVTNMPFAWARRLIDSLGLTTSSTVTASAKSYVVRAQQPAAGAFVPAGAPVMLALEPIDSVSSVPRLVGLRIEDANAHAVEDGFKLSIQKRRRALLTLFDRVATQESEMLTIARGDRLIEVDLATPLIPPAAAAIILVLAAAGAAVKARQPRTAHDTSKPIGDLDIDVVLPDAPPVLAPIPNDRVISTAITFTLGTEHGEWTVEPAAETLISHIEKHV